MEKLLFKEKIRGDSNAFIKKLLAVATELGVSPNWLMAVFNSESNFNPQAYNSSSGASGILQWLPKTAKGLGITTEQIRNMSSVQQLEYVLRYFKPFKHLIKKYEDLYLITFYPNADGMLGATLKKPDTWTFPNQVYLQNKVVDMDRDGKISIADFKKFVYKKVPAEFHKTLEEATVSEGRTFKLSLAVIALLFLIIYHKQVSKTLTVIWKKIQ